MERNVTQHTIDRLKQTACAASPNHGLTPIEIQRWEDDGGAFPAGPWLHRKRYEWYHHEEPYERAAAE